MTVVEFLKRNPGVRLSVKGIGVEPGDKCVLIETAGEVFYLSIGEADSLIAALTVVKLAAQE